MDGKKSTVSLESNEFKCYIGVAHTPERQRSEGSQKV